AGKARRHLAHRSQAIQRPGEVLCLTNSSTSNQPVREGNDYFAGSTRQKTRTLEKSQNTAHKLALVRRTVLDCALILLLQPKGALLRRQGERVRFPKPECPMWNQRCALGANVIGHHVHCSRFT